MFLCLDRFSDNIPVLFFVAIIVCTLWEYIVGVLLEVIFKTKYWDYSHMKFNFQGRICLSNSICWGVLGVLLIRYIHPFVVSIIQKIDISLIQYIVVVGMMIFLVDMITSIIKVVNIKSTLEKVEKLNAEIKEKLRELKESGKDTHKAKESISQVIEQLKKKRNRTILHLYRNVYRLKKAFPAINTKEITEILSRKVELKRKDKQVIEKKVKENEGEKN